MVDGGGGCFSTKLMMYFMIFPFNFSLLKPTPGLSAHQVPVRAEVGSSRRAGCSMALGDAFCLCPQPCGRLKAGNLCCAQNPEELAHRRNLGTSAFKSLGALGYLSQGTIPYSRNNLLDFPV